MRTEDHEHIAQCCHSLVGLSNKGREFTPDEFDRFIDRLVWAINASPGGRLTDEQRTALYADIINVLNSCARTSEPTKLIAERLVGLFDEKLRVEDAPIDFDRFVKRCKGEMG